MNSSRKALKPCVNAAEAQKSNSAIVPSGSMARVDNESPIVRCDCFLKSAQALKAIALQVQGDFQVSVDREGLIKDPKGFLVSFLAIESIALLAKPACTRSPEQKRRFSLERCSLGVFAHKCTYPSDRQTG